MITRRGNSPLARYANTRNLDDDLEDIDAFLSRGWCINYSCPLAKAARRGDLDLMEVLIYKGADVYKAMRKAEDAATLEEIAWAFISIRRGILEHGDYLENATPSPLTSAALRGRLERARQLIAWGANVPQAMRECGVEGEAAIDLLYDAVWDLAEEVRLRKFRKPKGVRKVRPKRLSWAIKAEQQPVDEELGPPPPDAWRSPALLFGLWRGA